MGVKTTHSVYVYTECESTLGVCKKTLCNKITVHTHQVCFYTQCIRIQNVLFLHPSHEFIALHIFTHTEYTQCVVLHTECNKS